MTKRRIHHILDGAEDIIAENAANEGAPRTNSVARAQESWEEFKEKSNHAAEAVIDELTNPDVLRTRVKKVARRTRGFYRTYQTYFWIGAGLLVLGVVAAAVIPAVARKRKERFSVDLGIA